MNCAIIALGSNINPEGNILAAANVLKTTFKKVCFSSVYQSRALGMDAEDFLNACCKIISAPKQETLLAWLKDTEVIHGRPKSHDPWAPRTLDLDLLVYNEVILDDNYWRYPHVFVPLSELYPIKTHHYDKTKLIKKAIQL